MEPRSLARPQFTRLLLYHLGRQSACRSLTQSTSARTTKLCFSTSDLLRVQVCARSDAVSSSQPLQVAKLAMRGRVWKDDEEQWYGIASSPLEARARVMSSTKARLNGWIQRLLRRLELGTRPALAWNVRSAGTASTTTYTDWERARRTIDTAVICYVSH